ncbi:hypothetical protein NDU88_003390 [Pleurodeles waltl]|uniref:Uncharacterized protein n=1 Tax=Pleurodeles waltl TaxID=8319 RepID=A0AAV7UF11_PLEWA|nr:hypothetical protein NDU88_003390 [Pleurodeles waltl]
MAELKTGFKTIEMRLDGMHERLDDHSTRISATEQQIPDMEDGSAALTKHVERAECLLKTVVAKNKDLEAQACRSNIRVVGVTESTNTRPISKYVEQLLIKILGRDSFGPTFIVERAQRSIAPPPSNLHPKA